MTTTERAYTSPIWYTPRPVPELPVGPPGLESEPRTERAASRPRGAGAGPSPRRSRRRGRGGSGGTDRS